MQTKNVIRVAAFREREREKGRKQRNLYLTDEELVLVKALVQRLRGGKGDNKG